MGPVFRKQQCMEHPSTPTDEGSKPKHIQSFVQSLCPHRAAWNSPRQSRGKRDLLPQGAWWDAAGLSHTETQFSSIPPFTQRLFVHNPRLPSPRQTQHCLAKGQMICCAARGDKDDESSSRDPATLRCHQTACKTAQAGQRGLILSASQEGNPRVLDAVTLPLPSHSYHCQRAVVLHGSHRSGLEEMGHTRTYKFPTLPSSPDCASFGHELRRAEGAEATLPPVSQNLPPRHSSMEDMQSAFCRGHGVCTEGEGWVKNSHQPKSPKPPHLES